MIINMELQNEKVISFLILSNLLFWGVGCAMQHVVQFSSVRSLSHVLLFATL